MGAMTRNAQYITRTVKVKLRASSVMITPVRVGGEHVESITEGRESVKCNLAHRDYRAITTVR